MKTIEVDPSPEALAPFEPAPILETKSTSVTPAQAKIDAIANLTHTAYAKASELRLTEEETAALQADFPDDAFQPGAAGKEHLIYIQHAYLRDRFIKVFGMGQWAIIPRNRWAEDFRTSGGKPASRVYVEAMLVIRGCFCAEAIGEMEYYPNNASQNYGDAVEGAKTAALRRCAKELGVGLQAWKKEFCDGWWVRRNTGSPRNAPQSTPAPRSEPKVDPAPTPPKKANPEQRRRFLEALEPCKEQATAYFRATKQLGPTEHLSMLTADHCPTTKAQFDTIMDAIYAFELVPEPTDENPTPGIREAEPTRNGEAWRTFPMPWGKHKGQELAKINLPEQERVRYLYRLFKNMKDEPPWTPEFRQALYEMAQHYRFDQPKE